MPFTITAEFPLGFYQGRNPAGQVEETPTPLRLLSALTAAAGSGSHAEQTEDGLRISPAGRAALTWLEDNPPDEISYPQLVVNDPGVTAFRKLGLRIRDSFDLPTAKAAIARTSLNGPIHWRWHAQPPEDVLKTLSELLGEVPYLGEAASLVVMRASTDEFELHDPVARVDSPHSGSDALTLPVPAPGRLAALEAHHLRTMKRGASNPSVKNEAEVIAPWPDEGIRQLWYEPQRREQPTGSPWSEAFIVEVSAGTPWPPPFPMYVRWSVALHRTLVRALGTDVPPVITGRYEPGLPRPANHLSIQVLLRTDNLNHAWADTAAGGFVVLIPSSASAEERSVIYQALSALRGRHVRPDRSHNVQVTALHQRFSNDFWQPPAAGHKRFWVTRPLAITDTRPLGPDSAGRSWTLTDALHLSVGMAWRDEFEAGGRGEELYRSLAAAASTRTRVISAQRVHDAQLHRFVHRTQPGNVVTGYRALLDMGDLLPDTAPAAIGQSRHVGGGLLVPLDVPHALLDEDGTPLWN